MDLENTVKGAAYTTIGYGLVSGIVGSLKNMAEHPLTYKWHPIDEMAYVYHFAADHIVPAACVIGAAAVVGFVMDARDAYSTKRHEG